MHIWFCVCPFNTLPILAAPPYNRDCVQKTEVQKSETPPVTSWCSQTNMYIECTVVYRSAHFYMQTLCLLNGVIYWMLSQKVVLCVCVTPRVSFWTSTHRLVTLKGDSFFWNRFGGVASAGSAANQILLMLPHPNWTMLEQWELYWKLLVLLYSVQGWMELMSYEQEMTTRTKSTSQTRPNTSPQPLLHNVIIQHPYQGACTNIFHEFRPPCTPWEVAVQLCRFLCHNLLLFHKNT
jgi:hypothetical protein